jgi:hypothetical protein
MADENSILGTSGKEAIPFEYQVQEQDIARKRSIAQALLARSQKAVPQAQMFGLHRASPGVLPYINNALDAYLGQRGLGQASEEQAAMVRDMQASRTGDMQAVQTLANGVPKQLTPQAGPPREGQPDLPPILQGGVKPDIKAAIARAMQSKWGNVQAQGLDMLKDQRAQRDAIGKMIGEGDIVAGASYIQGNDPQAPIPAIKLPAAIFGTDPNGNSYAQTQDLKGGKPTITYAPKAMTVTQTNGGKTDIELDKKYIDLLDKSRTEVVDIPNQIGTIVRTNELLNKGAVTGGGASTFQAVRKFGQAFGVQIPETGLTEEMRMRLGDNILANARKLAPVTSNDVTMLQQLLGSIDTDPSAMREINAMMLAKNLMTVDRHNAQVEEVRQQTSGTPSKYNPFRMELNRIDTKDPALLGRTYQLMKEAGHDMSKYTFDGKPVSDIDLNFSFQKPADSAAPLAVDPRGRIKRVAP